MFNRTLNLQWFLIQTNVTTCILILQAFIIQLLKLQSLDFDSLWKYSREWNRKLIILTMIIHHFCLLISFVVSLSVLTSYCGIKLCWINLCSIIVRFINILMLICLCFFSAVSNTYCCIYCLWNQCTVIHKFWSIQLLVLVREVGHFLSSQRHR